MKKLLILILLLLGGVFSARAQTPLWAGKTAAQGNTFLSPYTGTWNGSVVSGQYGGTGVNNGSNTITLGGNLTTSGAYTCTLTLTNTTSVTLPTSGTLQTTTGTPAGFVIASQAAGDILYASSTTAWSRLGKGSDGALLTLASGVPAWTTPTFPTAATPTTRKIIVSNGTNWVASTETYAVPGTSGNVLTSDGTNWVSSAPTSTTVTAVTADQTAAVNVIYVNNKSGSQLVLTLPATAAVGSEIEVIGGSNAAGVKFAGISGSIFHAGTTTGATGTGGYISSTDQYGTCMIICIVQNTEWEIVTSSGSWSLN